MDAESEAQPKARISRTKHVIRAFADSDSASGSFYPSPRQHAGGFDYQVENRDNSLDEAVAAIDSIITSERRRDGRTPLRLL